ncbi:3-isopropylmalate dehydratase [Pseudomonas cavernae]|uniref:3-isopropylmalate dehydratase n=1 Tax=Pseudomonas cavernae TaxID=2320867 RepID=A0A385Z4V7_9PSED|nr:3-isopropylmalate dehydratase [Pseudomonas cavernae]AYC33784.1 3-isopropylmalate dehydratase [Pseudomonas cavernae]
MRSILAVLPLLLLAGCSSYRADLEQVKAVPGDRLLAYQQPVDGSGQIVVNRDLGMLGGGCYVAVLVDRQVAARIGVGEVATFQVPAGARVVGIAADEQDETLCGKGRLRRERAVQVAAGESYRFRIVSENKEGFAIRPDQP